MSRRDDIQREIKMLQRRLQKRREQKAMYGPSADPSIDIEIEELEARIEQLQSNPPLHEYGPPPIEHSPHPIVRLLKGLWKLTLLIIFIVILSFVVTNFSPSNDEGIDPTKCVINIRTERVGLKSEPDPFSRDIIEVPVGQYIALEHRITRFANSEFSWFLIEVETRTGGKRTGWVQDNLYHIDNKSDACP